MRTGPVADMIPRRLAVHGRLRLSAASRARPHCYPQVRPAHRIITITTRAKGYQATSTATAEPTTTAVIDGFPQKSSISNTPLQQEAPPAWQTIGSVTNDGPHQQASDHRRESLLSSLNGSPPCVPCSFLYDTRGSELYEHITQLPEYYPFEAEKKLLATHLAAITAHIPADGVVLELGCGVADKTAPLLQALLDRHGALQSEWVYVGLDVSEAALTKARESLLERVQGLGADRVDTVCAEYLEGVRLTCRKYPGRKVTMLWLGSSIGNLSTEEAINFLKATQREANGADVQMLVCTDLWKDTETLRAAYDDSQGVTCEFILNGMVHALRSLGQQPPAAIKDAWKYVVNVNQEQQQVEMWLEAKQAVSWPGGGVRAGESVLMEISRKYTMAGVRGMAGLADMVVQDCWSDGSYAMHLLVPPMAALRTCWEASDRLFAGIDDWAAKPIDLRHPLGFYYGHVAAFCKLKVLGLQAAAAGGLDYLLSRGIDPLVNDPSKCHDHPPEPPSWPSKVELKQYVLQARKGVETHIKKQAATNQDVFRQVSLALEHEWMHQETMWHLLLQQRKAALSTLSPTATPTTNPTIAANNNTASAGSNGFARVQQAPAVEVLGGMVVLGVPMGGQVGYVWDNEGPPQEPIWVEGFRASRRAVSIGEYQKFVAAGGYRLGDLWQEGDLEHLGRLGVQQGPATWSMQADGGAKVQQLDGTFDWQQVADRAVWVSLAEAEAYAKWVGGGARIMTEPEYCLALQHDPHCARIVDLQSGGYEWTTTPFHPYLGFSPSPEYPEYSEEFFDGLHFALRGASPATAPGMRRSSFRNFYQRLFPFAFSKFRLVYPLEAPQ